MIGLGVANDDSFTGDVHSGATAVRGTFAATGSNWGGAYSMNSIWSRPSRQPSENWGTEPNAGVDVTGATKLIFWARGARVASA